MADFSASVERWVRQAKGRSEAAFRAMGMEAGGRVKELTPVVTGFLRANWLDTIDVDVEMKPGWGKNLGEAIAQAKIGDTIYILNPVVYARRIEYGFVGEDSLGRRYNQPGRGMVQQVLAELPEIAESAVVSVSSGGYL